MVLSGRFQNHLHRELGRGNGGAEQDKSLRLPRGDPKCHSVDPCESSLSPAQLSGQRPHLATGQPARVSSPKGQRPHEHTLHTLSPCRLPVCSPTLLPLSGQS